MNKGSVWIGFLLFLSLLLGGGAIGYSYYQTLRLNQALVQKTEPFFEYQSTTQSEFTALKEKDRTLDERQEQLRSRIDILEGEPSFFSLVPPKQRLVWQLGEAAYLSRLARHKLVYEHDFQTAELLLVELDALLLDTKDPNLYFIHQEVENKLQDVKKFKEEHPKLISLFTPLIKHAEQLPEECFQSAVTQSFTDISEPQEENEEPKWKRTLLSWWKQLKASIQIRKMDEKIIASPSFEIAIYTLINRLEQTKLALLQNDETTYQAELARAEEWLRDHFQEKNPSIKALLEQLSKLNAEPIGAVPDLTSLTTLLTTAIENQQKSL